MEDLAKHFVTSVVMDMIGVQGEVREKMLAWGEAAFNLLGPMNQRAADSFPIAGELFEWTHHQLKAQDLAEGSMGRAVFEAAERGDIAPESAGMIVHQYIAAGMDTTIAALGSGRALRPLPRAFQKLREDRSLIPSASTRSCDSCPLPSPADSSPGTPRCRRPDSRRLAGRNPGGAANRDTSALRGPTPSTSPATPRPRFLRYGIHGARQAWPGSRRMQYHALATHLRDTRR